MFTNIIWYVFPFVGLLEYEWGVKSEWPTITATTAFLVVADNSHHGYVFLWQDLALGNPHISLWYIHIHVYGLKFVNDSQRFINFILIKDIMIIIVYAKVKCIYMRESGLEDSTPFTQQVNLSFFSTSSDLSEFALS